MPDTMQLTANPYARFLSEPIAAGRSVDQILTSTPRALESILQSLTPPQLITPRAPGKWSPAEVLAHLADCEIAFAFRLRQTLAEDNHTIQPFDQDNWAERYPAIAQAADLAQESLATFLALRHWNLILIQTALPTFASKPASHPERGDMTFQTIVETMAGHDLNHLLQLRVKIPRESR